MKIAVIQGSLSPDSKTAIVVDLAVKQLRDKNITVDLIDLREHDLEFCDGRPLEEYSQNTQNLYKRMQEASAYIIGMPVYQVGISGPLKNFLDIMAGAMFYRVAGVLCNSGGIRSYLAPVDILKTLSYECWTITVQPTVHTWAKDFADGKIVNEKALEKLPLLIENVIRYSKVEPAKP